MIEQLFYGNLRVINRKKKELLKSKHKFKKTKMNKVSRKKFKIKIRKEMSNNKI
jgi:hypothetical protein